LGYKTKTDDACYSVMALLPDDLLARIQVSIPPFTEWTAPPKGRGAGAVSDFCTRDSFAEFRIRISRSGVPPRTTPAGDGKRRG